MLSDIKSQARSAARKRRKAATQTVHDATERAARAFLNSVPFCSDDIIALYRPIQSELDPTPLIIALQEQGVVTCFPVVIAADTPLEFRAADSGTRFIKGAFGAEIPDDTASRVTPSLVIAPLLAFDRALYRLGYGGGFYDRTLEKLRGAQTTRAYGYAYSAQEADQVPIEPTDQKLDGIVTENGLIS